MLFIDQFEIVLEYSDSLEQNKCPYFQLNRNFQQYNHQNCYSLFSPLMEKLVANLTKQSTLSHLGLLAKSQKLAPTSINPSILRIVQNELEKAITASSNARLITFFEPTAFRQYLKEKMPDRSIHNLHYNLNSKMFPLLLPQNNFISVFHSPFFKWALKLTNPQKITFSNPFKTMENLSDAANSNIGTLVVNTLEEIEQIQKINHRFKFVWEFDEIDLKEAKSIFKLLISKKVCLSGLGFKDISQNLIPQIQNIVNLGRRYGHDLSFNTFQIGINQVADFRMMPRYSDIRLNLLINDLDTSKFTLCAAKVIGKNKRTKVYAEKVGEVLGQSKDIIDVKVGNKEWTLFNPKKSIDLEGVSDNLLNMDLWNETEMIDR